MIKPPFVSFAIGKRGGGKSTLTTELMKSNSRFIVYDYMNEYKVEQFNAVPVYFFNDFKMLLLRKEPRIIFKPRRKGKPTFEFFCQLILLYAEDYMLFVEEINRVSGGKYFQELIDVGRHSALGVHGNARRPFGLDMTFISQVDCFFIGKVNEIPVDMGFYKSFLPKNAMEQISSLPRFQFLRYLPEPERLGLSESDALKIVQNTAPIAL